MKFREQSSVHFTLQILQLRSSDLNAAWSWLHLLSFFASNSVKKKKGGDFFRPQTCQLFICVAISSFLDHASLATVLSEYMFCKR